MRYTVTASFFRVSNPEEGSPDFPDLLRAIANENLAGREKEISRGVFARLEQIGADGDFLEGDFCRKQIDDIPPSAGPAGLNQINLGAGQGLGYLAAFRYHLPTRVLLLERNKMSVSNVRCSVPAFDGSGLG